ncbi:MAG: hypothetical protein KGL39_60105 [Patescibacteria group bacterium]|nr:hypothetical protein [Patescibacteria group bacterium]
MNLCEALIIVRNCALASQQMKVKRGQEALKIIDRKIQGLLRSKGWRESYRTMPIHAGNDSFLYPIPGADHVDMAIAPGVTALVAPTASPETIAALQEMARIAGNQAKKMHETYEAAKKNFHKSTLKLD